MTALDPLWRAMGERADWVIILVGVAAILVFIDLRLAKLFQRHELTERRMYAELALTSDGAAAGAREASRDLRDVRGRLESHGSAVASLQADVKMHDKRLGAVEERLMRAALTVPVLRRPGGND
jgi:hypothetical protein